MSAKLELVSRVFAAILAGLLGWLLSQRAIQSSEPVAYVIESESETPLYDGEEVRWRYTDLPMTNCAWCRKTLNLNRHHAIPQSFRPDLRDVKTNLVVLCRNCHFCLGHRGDWKQYNPDVIEIVGKYTNTVRKVGK